MSKLAMSKGPLLLIACMLVLVLVVAEVLLEKVNNQSTVITEKWLPSVQLVEQINRQTADLRNKEAIHIISTDHNTMTTVDGLITKDRGVIELSISEYKSLISSPEEQHKFEHFYNTYLQYLSVQDELLALSRQNQNLQAKELLLDHSLKLYDEYSAVLVDLSQLNIRSADIASGYANSIYQNVHLLEQVFLTSAALFAVFSALLVARQWIDNQGFIEFRVKQALKQSSFHCAYQPIIDLKTGELVGVEMLARLNDSKGTIYPDTFIPIIMRTGNSWKFTQMIVEKSLKELNQLDSLPPTFKVNFNLFPADVGQNYVTNIINFAGINQFKGQIVLEITENELLAKETAHKNIAQLIEHGFLIAIDDFGTGYANLNQLEAISAHFLKIDRSFISDVDDDSIKSALIPHIVRIANDLGMEVVAEGVESQAQHQALLHMKIHQGQGWNFGKPIMLDELIAKIPSSNVTLSSVELANGTKPT